MSVIVCACVHVCVHVGKGRHITLFCALANKFCLSCKGAIASARQLSLPYLSTIVYTTHTACIFILIITGFIPLQQ